jgi:hypothetical protein
VLLARDVQGVLETRFALGSIAYALLAQQLAEALGVDPAHLRLLLYTYASPCLEPRMVFAAMAASWRTSTHAG